MYIIDKTGLTVLATTFAYGASTSHLTNKLQQSPGEVKGDGMVFAFVAFMEKNFQTYYVLFGYCLDRDTNNVCTGCYTGGYLDSTSAGNTCLTKAQFPSRNGADEALKRMKPCSDSNCVDCIDDYTVCVACDTVAKYYRSSSNTCIYFQSITGSQGANLGTGGITNCASSGCLDCRADHTKCTTCNTGSNYYLDVASNACLLVSAIPDGKGADLTSGKVETCTSIGCKKCQADRTKCTECYIVSGYYLQTSSQFCFTVPGMPARNVANSVTGLVTGCSDSNCIVCSSKYTECSSCDVNAQYFL